MKWITVTRRKWKDLEPILDRYVAEQLGDDEKSEIDAFNSSEHVGAKMSYKHFVAAVIAEMGNPAFIMTSASLEEKWLQASDRVFAKMQKETKRVV
jgi:hypothetical protein